MDEIDAYVTETAALSDARFLMVEGQYFIRMAWYRMHNIASVMAFGFIVYQGAIRELNEGLFLYIVPIHNICYVSLNSLAIAGLLTNSEITEHCACCLTSVLKRKYHNLGGILSNHFQAISFLMLTGLLWGYALVDYTAAGDALIITLTIVAIVGPYAIGIGVAIYATRPLLRRI